MGCLVTKMAARGDRSFNDVSIPLDTIDGASSDAQDGLFGSRPDVSHFSLDVKELRELMEYRTREAVQFIRDKYGGVRNICKLLYTSENEGNRLMQERVIRNWAYLYL